MQALIANKQLLEDLLREEIRNGLNLTPEEEIAIMMLKKLDSLRDEQSASNKRLKRLQTEVEHTNKRINDCNETEKYLSELLSQALTDEIHESLVGKLLKDKSTVDGVMS